MKSLPVRRAPSRFWSGLHRLGLARAKLPFWRVVVEGKLNPRMKTASARWGRAVAGVFVWARTIEEAEGLAALALRDEGVETVTADAVRWPPGAAPSRTPQAVARTPFGYLPLQEEDARGRSSRQFKA